jgi:metal iron transporter
VIQKVIGTAIALNLLINVPLVAGCAISILDVLILLAFYRPSASIIWVRAFEFFVVVLVLAVAVCFSIELSMIQADIGSVFKGYLPSSALVQSQG